MTAPPESPRTLGNHPMPYRIALLPRDRHGYPTPWFVATLEDGTRDFRIADQERHIDALRFKLCWVCGGALGAQVAFALGPMCAVNRISADPPSHRDCAVYAVLVCPFLATPHMQRRTSHIPDGVIEPAGTSTKRNPGVTLVWVTRRFKPFRAQFGARGILCALGDPTALCWYREGRPATRAEVLDSIDTGLPALQETCLLDDDPAASQAALDADYRRALALVPAA